MNGDAVELLQPVDVEPAVAGAGGDNDGPRLDALSGAAEVDAAGIVAAFEPYRLVGNGDLDPELLRLVEGPGHERDAGNSGRGSRGSSRSAPRHRLPAERSAIEHQDGETLGGGVNRCRQPRRSRTDDDNIERLSSSGVRPDPRSRRAVPRSGS